MAGVASSGWLLSALVGVPTANAAPRLLPAERQTATLYVALGDSTVAGVGASDASLNYVSHLYRRLRAVYPEARVVNLGTSGATSADVLARQLPAAVKLAPQLVTLSIEPNDLTGKVPVEHLRLVSAFCTLVRWADRIPARHSVGL